MLRGQGTKRPALDGPILGAILVSVIATVGVIVIPFAKFAYLNPSLHIVFETIEALIAFLAAFLVFGRFRVSGRASELTLVYVLVLLGSTNFFFTVFDALFEMPRSDTFRIWAPTIARVVGSIVIVGAAFGFKGTLTKAGRGLPVVLSALGTLVAIAGVVYVLQDRLPDLRSVSVVGDASRPQIRGDVGIYLPQATMAVMFAAAAVGFARSAARTGDELTRWLAGGSVMNAFARLHFVLFPSIYTDFVYSGDFLRLGFYLMLLVGAGREIRSYWRGLTQVAVTEERRRLARDLHDGLAQELVFISAQTHRLLSRDPEPHDLKRLASAADRAVAESRRAIVALSHGQETLTDALRDLVDETSRRFGVPVFAELAPIDVSSQVKEGVLRIAREALVNAIKHGDTEVVSVFLEGGWLTKLRVSDDGRGFDPDRPGSDGFGLTVMEEKARALGGELEVRSVPGGGTIVELRLPG